MPPHIEKEVFVCSSSPWYNEDVQKDKQSRRKAERKYIKERLTIHLDMLRTARRDVTKLRVKLKQEYFMNLDNNASDSKTLFRITNKLLRNSRDTTLSGQ